MDIKCRGHKAIGDGYRIFYTVWMGSGKKRGDYQTAGQVCAGVDGF